MMKKNHRKQKKSHQKKKKKKKKKENVYQKYQEYMGITIEEDIMKYIREDIQNIP